MCYSCSVDIDECSPSPCLYGGRCIDLIGQYQCDCSVRFPSSSYQLYPNGKLSNLCIKFSDGQSLSTQETGYSGINCMYKESDTVSTCFNYGVKHPVSGKCSCLPGNYPSPVSRCTLSYNHKGTLDQRFFLVTWFGWSLQVIWFPYVFYIISWLLNIEIWHLWFFTCELSVGFFVGYTGSQCEALVDECQHNFCGENGDCIDGIDNFTCVCKVRRSMQCGLIFWSNQLKWSRKFCPCISTHILQIQNLFVKTLLWNDYFMALRSIILILKYSFEMWIWSTSKALRSITFLLWSSYGMHFYFAAWIHWEVLQWQLGWVFSQALLEQC